MNRAVAATATLFLSLGTYGTAVAEPTMEDIAKYRHSVMEVLAGHMSALAMIVQGKVDQGEFTSSHAAAIASATAELSALFPAGSAGEDSHALPAIWENPQEFKSAVDSARDAGAALGEAAASGERKDVMKAFAAMGKSCKGCHEKYREEHDH